MDLFNMIDQAIANDLGITVDEYAARAEWLLDTDIDKGQEMIFAIIDEEEDACTKFMEATQNYLKDC